ncbi:MAG: hypothetical protein N2512_01360 [Armatimonadetes bacterium]|nr:hypothetical protein [Armatimonadota bacterium]
MAWEHDGCRVVTRRYVVVLDVIDPPLFRSCVADGGREPLAFAGLWLEERGRCYGDNQRGASGARPGLASYGAAPGRPCWRLRLYLPRQDATGSVRLIIGRRQGRGYSGGNLLKKAVPTAPLPNSLVLLPLRQRQGVR